MPDSPDLIAWSVSSTPRGLALPEGEIHVWRASLDRPPDILLRLEANLGEDERSRAARFHFPRDRDHFIAARGILRELLGSYLGRSPVALEFSYGTRGKPSLLSEDSRFPIRFNISHSHGFAAFAFSRGRDVGIDLEQIRPAFGGEEIAERYFSARELDELRALSPELIAEGFFICWTRKEAYVKARGAGLQIPLDSFSVSLTPGRPETLDSADAQRWSLRSFQPATNFVGAVVGEGKDWQPRYWEWVAS